MVFLGPMCDAFLVLAHTPAGLSCFLMPRFAPDGTRNAHPYPAP
jgi:putative acyl-CoA dehydrogenase